MVPFELNDQQRVMLNSFCNDLDRDINAMMLYAHPDVVKSQEEFVFKGATHGINARELDIIEQCEVDAFYDTKGYIRAVHIPSRRLAYFCVSSK